MAQNMYRVGDFVYMETTTDGPYAIRKIDELIKTPNGVDARVSCFYRRRDIETALLKISDQAERKFQEFFEVDKAEPKDFHPGIGHTVAHGHSEVKVGTENASDIGDCENSIRARNEVTTGFSDDCDDLSREWGNAGLPLGAEKLQGVDRHLFRHRELFLSRAQETVSATLIRGRCLVTLLNEVEDLECYSKDDHFFYSLVYDPAQQTLLADKGAIRVSEKYQAEVPEHMENETKLDSDDNKENGDDLMIDENDEEESTSHITEREILVYHPHHSLSDRDIDQFLIIARAVGTFSRALDTSSSMKLPSLHMTAAAASRDVTLFHAMALLHQAGYDIGQATKFLCPPPSKQHYPLDADRASGHNTISLGGPILCRDQLEEWSAAESNLFEEALDKYGKDFHDVKVDYLPWKSIRDIVEYYYMWKTTNRYVDAKKTKQLEHDNKLKQLYVPLYNKPNPNLIGAPNPSGGPVKSPKLCESCECDEAPQWYAWGPPSAQLRICQDCFTVWKKLGTIKKPHAQDTFDLREPERESASKAAMAAVAEKSNPVLPRIPMSKNVQGQVVARLAPTHPVQMAIQAAQAAGAGPQAQAAAAAAAQAAIRRGANPEIALNLVTSSSSRDHNITTADAKTPTGKSRVTFNLVTTLMTKIARRVTPKNILNIKKAARRPFDPLNSNAIKQHCMSTDPNVLLRVAQAIKGNRLSPQFIQAVLANFQMMAASGMKRPASQQDNLGPVAKKQTSS